MGSGSAARHGDGPPIPDEALLWLLAVKKDPDLALVHADMRTWSRIYDDHCECQGKCVCEAARG